MGAFGVLVLPEVGLSHVLLPYLTTSRVLLTSGSWASLRCELQILRLGLMNCGMTWKWDDNSINERLVIQLIVCMISVD